MSFTIESPSTPPRQSLIQEQVTIQNAIWNAPILVSFVTANVPLAITV